MCCSGSHIHFSSMKKNQNVLFLKNITLKQNKTSL